MDDREVWWERVRNIRADSRTWWWWWWTETTYLAWQREIKCCEERERRQTQTLILTFSFSFVDLARACTLVPSSQLRSVSDHFTKGSRNFRPSSHRRVWCPTNSFPVFYSANTALTAFSFEFLPANQNLSICCRSISFFNPGVPNYISQILHSNPKRRFRWIIFLVLCW